MTDQSEIRRHWTIVLACGAGIGAGVTGIPFYTLGLFVGPLETEFGWSRGQVQSMFLVFTVSGLLMVPAVAWLTDRMGVRSVVLMSLVGTAIGYLSLSQLTSSITSFYLAAAILAILGSGTTPVTWTKALSGWFDRQRGLALGIALAGTGAAAFAVPPFIAKVLSMSDWRMAYLSLMIFPLAAIPLVFALLKDPPGQGKNRGAGSHAIVPNGFTFREALLSWKLWVITGSFLILSAAIGGSISNLVPLMLDAGLTRVRAAELAGIMGVAVIIGRMGAGYLIDKLWAPAVAFVVQGLPVCSALILMQAQPSEPMLILAIFFIGSAAGAEFDLIAFLVSRYFGLRHYAKIYAVPYAAFAIGAGIAPAAFGYLYDAHGNYYLVMVIVGVFFGCGAAALLTLGAYPTLPSHDDQG
ncbi:MAG: OFA family oxalate/formate antiporter-like MFS transporter [Halieaceae bacterium]|jgi:OFA family oxalate/formate antiporter-like MFS transporter